MQKRENTIRFISRPLLVVLTGVFLAVWGGVGGVRAYAQSRAQPTSVDRIIGDINGHIILNSELEEQFITSQEQGGRTKKCDLLASMVYSKMLASHAELDSIPLTEEQVNGELERRFAAVVAQVGTLDQVKKLYGRTAEELKEDLRKPVRESLLADLYRNHLVGQITVGPYEVETFFTQASQNERPYYSAEVLLGQVVRKPKPTADAEEAAKAKLLQLRRRVLAGESFENLALVHSEDPSVSRNNGHLGFFRRGDLDPAYEAAALRLSEGEFSEPVRSQFGYHLIKLAEVRGNTFDTWHILMRLIGTREDLRKETQLLDSLRQAILLDSLSFEEAVKTYSEDQKTAASGGFFRAPNGGSYIPVDVMPTDLFFMIDTLEVGTLTPPVALKDPSGEDYVALFYYKDKVAAHVASLETDYTKIREAALKAKQEKVLARWLETAHKDLFITLDPQYNHCEVYERNTSSSSSKY